jgi:Mg-chelatase subunit ChlD
LDLICPTSELSLQELEDKWERRYGPIEDSIFEENVQFGVTPVVFFMPLWIADKYEVFKQPFGWKSLAKLSRDHRVRIRHASVQQRDGIAVAIAQHIALQPPDQQGPAEDIKWLEQAVEEYGPDDDEVIKRAVGKGDWAADVVIVQERSIVASSQRAPLNNGVIVYPNDGFLIIPNTVASVKFWERPLREEAFHSLVTGLTALPPLDLARSGLHKDVQSLASPDALRQFQSATQLKADQRLRWAPHAGGPPVLLPGRRSIRGIRSLVSSAKRGVDVCLLFDSSDSMDDGDKFPKAQIAIDEFVQLLQGADSRACLIRFDSRATVLTSLRSLSPPFYSPGSLDPRGKTALLDAVKLGVDTLENLGNPTHIWAIVAFTDGQENASNVTLAATERHLRRIPKIRFYGIAYGADADLGQLSVLASASGGIAARSDPATIRAVYERLSTYV